MLRISLRWFDTIPNRRCDAFSICNVVTNGNASYKIAREVDAHDMSESYGRSIIFVQRRRGYQHIGNSYISVHCYKNILQLININTYN